MPFVLLAPMMIVALALAATFAYRFLWPGSTAPSVSVGIIVGPPRALGARHSCIVERAEPIAAAIFRSLNPAAFSRNTSRILRTGNLCCATVDLLPFRKEAIVASVSLRDTCAGKLRNRGPIWPGNWPGMHRNQWPASSGIRKRDLRAVVANDADPLLALRNMVKNSPSEACFRTQTHATPRSLASGYDRALLRGRSTSPVES